RAALRRMAAPPLIQPDLAVNQPGDAWEQEADAVAERVIGDRAGAGAAVGSPLSPAGGIQRMADDEECIECAQNPHGIQRQADGGGTPTPSPGVAAYIRAPGPGMGLSPGLRRRIEPHIGVGLGEVRVHSGPAAAQAAASLQARAFTHGRDIFLRRSEYSRDLRLMAHEATHVAQQAAGIHRGIQRQVEEEPLQEVTAPTAAQPMAQAPPVAPPMPATLPLEVKPAPTPAPAAESATPAAPTVAAQPAPAPAPLPMPPGPAPATPTAPGVEPLMPEPALTLSDQEQARVARAERRAAANAAAQEALPPAERQVGEARAAVTEPDVETHGRAEASLTQALVARAEPSPEIEQLCEDIRRVIREKRPPDEESLVEADPSAMAQEAGQQLNASVEGDAQRVKGSYDPLQEPPPGEKVQEGDELAGQPEAEAAPNIAAESAVPDPAPAEEVSLDADVAASQARLDEAGMSSEPAKLIQSGPVAEARAAQGELEQTAASEPAEALAAQQAALASAGQEMAALQQQALAALAASRRRAVRDVDDRQHKMVGSEEQMRAAASTRARAIFSEAQSQVDAQLRDLPRKAMDKWKAGVALLSTQFEQRLHKVEGWIAERHSGGWGTVVQIWDEVTGYPDWVSEEYDIAEREFGDGVCKLIREISADVNTVIAACEGIIAAANEQIAAIFAALPENLQTWAAQEQAGFQEQLQGLSRRVAKTQADFTRDLAQQAAQTVQDARARIHALRQKAKGLLGRIADAIQRFVDDPVKFIIEGLLDLVGISPASFWALVNRIRSVISEIADDPAGFINNLVAALKAGFERFFENFPKHLVRGLFDWLFSSLGSVGVSLPADFSPKSLITFFLELMGITWPRIRALLAKHIGEQNVAWIEQAWGLLSELIQQGPLGIFEMIKDALNPSAILDMIVETATEMLQSALIKQVAVRVLALLNPVGAIVQAIELIYKVLKWVFENAARIFTLIEAIVGGIADILAGNIGG
ncbi:MAG TPA: DUF4157 domain-containing protein, partial [Caldilineaceae bacterium]|nr:DUF4157 domain-containing protein [Caldilineaceae bacterium]